MFRGPAPDRGPAVTSVPARAVPSTGRPAYPAVALAVAGTAAAVGAAEATNAVARS